ncbi:MAG: hypothetical protein M3R43_10535 [Acidobacteriota bacterium]|nr:hypothetical protein [Acidobacteriota bacterium]
MTAVIFIRLVPPLYRSCPPHAWLTVSRLASLFAPTSYLSSRPESALFAPTSELSSRPESALFADAVERPAGPFAPNANSAALRKLFPASLPRIE